MNITTVYSENIFSSIGLAFATPFHCFNNRVQNTYCHKMSHSVGQVGLPCGLRSIEHNTLVMLQLMMKKKPNNNGNATFHLYSLLKNAINIFFEINF